MSNTADTTAADRVTPPGPTALQRAVLAGRFARSDLVEVFEHLRDRFGRTVWLDLPGDDAATLLVSDPAHVEQILETKQRQYPKADIYQESLGEVFGEGLLTAEGDHWASQNRLIAPVFQPESVHAVGDLIIAETDAMLERWRDRDEVDLLAEMERVTLLIIGKAMFSTDMAEHATEMGAALAALRARFRQVNSGIVSLPEWVPTRTARRSERGRAYLDETVYDLIEKRRGRAEEYDDLLSRLLLAEDEETGRRMDDEQVRDEVVTFLLAGHETTAAALTWTWWLLSRHPEAHRRVAATVAESTLADPDPTFDPSLMEDLSVVERTLNEGMRLYPPVPFIGRKAAEDDTLGRYHVPEGVRVVVSQYLTHRDPGVWDAPDRFDPDRFRADDRPRYAFYPFGGGSRSCIGRLFATMEGVLILSRAVASCRLELAAPDPAETLGMNSAVTMTPETKPRMTPHWRRS